MGRSHRSGIVSCSIPAVLMAHAYADTSPSYIDVKVYNGNEILRRWIFRGCQADTDHSVQQQCADELFLRSANRGRPRLSVAVAAFSAWKVSVLSVERGGRTYWVGPGGVVMSANCARSR